MLPHCKNLSLKNIRQKINGKLYVEKWRPIIGFENRCSVSSFGRVKSHSRWANAANTDELIFKEERILRLRKVSKGYLAVVLYDAFCDTKQMKVHRLVAIHFIPNPLNLPEVNHKKNKKTDNRMIKLEWSTGENNLKHSWKNGYRDHLLGENNSRSVLSEKDVIKIYKDKRMHKVIAKHFGVSVSTVTAIKNHRTWKRTTNKL